MIAATYCLRRVSRPQGKQVQPTGLPGLRRCGYQVIIIGITKYQKMKWTISLTVSSENQVTGGQHFWKASRNGWAGLLRRDRMGWAVKKGEPFQRVLSTGVEAATCIGGGGGAWPSCGTHLLLRKKDQFGKVAYGKMYCVVEKFLIQGLTQDSGCQ